MTHVKFVLVIQDFGRGFEVNAARGEGGLGLASMEERVRLVGGSLTVESKAGEDTRIEAHVPLPAS
ncbi:MAG: ATP-binding protein [Terriglobia bacterium]